MINKDKILRHLLYMTNNMPNKQEDLYKWNRWLGYIQGQVVVLGLTSLGDCIEVNRGSVESGLLKCRISVSDELKKMYKLNKNDDINYLALKWEDDSDDVIDNHIDDESCECSICKIKNTLYESSPEKFRWICTCNDNDSLMCVLHTPMG